jgi:hypothetical protein
MLDSLLLYVQLSSLGVERFKLMPILRTKFWTTEAASAAAFRVHRLWLLLRDYRYRSHRYTNHDERRPHPTHEQLSGANVMPDSC